MARDTMGTMCRVSQREGRQAGHWPGCQRERSRLEGKKRLLQLIPASPTKALLSEMATARTMSAADGRSHRPYLCPALQVSPHPPYNASQLPAGLFLCTPEAS